MASVNIWRVEGAGGVRAYRNGILVADLTPSISSITAIAYNIGDSFKFEAYPSSGWQFNKFCGDPSCTIISTSNPLTGYISIENGNVYVYFTPISVSGYTVTVIPDSAWMEPPIPTYSSGTINYGFRSDIPGDICSITSPCRMSFYYPTETWSMQVTKILNWYSTTHPSSKISKIVADNGYVLYTAPVAATITVSIAQGSGTVQVYKNGSLLGQTSTSSTFNFVVGDIAQFQANPSTGYSFTKFCGDTACSITSTSNPLYQMIQSSGSVIAYFTASPCSRPTVSMNIATSPLTGYTLVWSDEFNGTSVDTSKWNVLNQLTGTGFATYTPSNVTVSNGYLHFKIDYQNLKYTTGGVTTNQKFSQAYGYFEMKARLPKGQGLWNAFWMLPQDGSWPPEIDIIEMNGKYPNTVYFTTHWGTSTAPLSRGSSYTGADFSQDYHIFAIEWLPGKIRWFVDNIQRYETDPDVPVPSNPFYIFINTTLGVPWAGYPDATTVFPQYYDIDYVRVYKKVV